MMEKERAVELLKERRMTVSMCATAEWCKEQNEALDMAIEALSAGWIPALTLPLFHPEENEEVLVCTRSKNGHRNIDKGYYANERYVHRGTAEVTHWMHLPELPSDQRCE